MLWDSHLLETRNHRYPLTINRNRLNGADIKNLNKTGRLPSLIALCGMTLFYFLFTITVGPPIAGRPPYRSLRAVFPHKAPRFKLSLLPHQCGSIKLQTASYLASLLCKDTALYTAPTYR
jgi:hypothetical protein